MTEAIKRPLIDIIAGARPNFMKIAAIIRSLQLRQAGGSPLRYRLIHTGPHYDARMSGDFFDQLEIPKPDLIWRLAPERRPSKPQPSWCVMKSSCWSSAAISVGS